MAYDLFAEVFNINVTFFFLKYRRFSLSSMIIEDANWQHQLLLLYYYHHLLVVATSTSVALTDERFYMIFIEKNTINYQFMNTIFQHH